MNITKTLLFINKGCAVLWIQSLKDASEIMRNCKCGISLQTLVCYVTPGKGASALRCCRQKLSTVYALLHSKYL